MGFEIDFLPVGNSNGDAICIRYGDEIRGYTIHVVDGGYSDTAERIIEHITAYFGSPRYIDHVVLSHADHDHAAGLIGVMEHFAVGTLWMNRPWLFAAEAIHNFHQNYTEQGLRQEIRRMNPHLVELERIALLKGVEIRDAFAGNKIGAFTVLAPTKERYLALLPEFGRTPQSYAEGQKSLADLFLDAAKKVVKWFETWASEQLSDAPVAVSASNESSLVQWAEIDGSRILLTADAGPQALEEAANVAQYLSILGSPNMIQIPHHGSRRNVTPRILNRWLGYPVAEGGFRGLAICSVGTNKPEYPRHRVKNAFLRRGYSVTSTRDGWKSFFKDIPPKPNSVQVTSDPFSYEYEE